MGLELPPAGLHCSPLLGVEERIEFAERVLSAAVDKALAGEGSDALRSWLTSEIGAWGGDGIGLTAQGYRWWRGGAGRELAVDALDEAWLG